MSDRSAFVAAIRAAREVMQRTGDAHSEYVNARDGMNAEFCLFANRYGWKAASAAMREAEEVR